MGIGLYAYMAAEVAHIKVNYADYVVARGFMEAFDEWVNGCKAVPKMHWLTWPQRRSEALPWIGKITAALIVGIYGLRAIPGIVEFHSHNANARGRHETAHRVRVLAGRVFRYAVATGRAQHGVAADFKDALAPVKSKNFASVADPIRVGEFMRAIDGYSQSRDARRLRPVAGRRLKRRAKVSGSDETGNATPC